MGKYKNYQKNSAWNLDPMAAYKGVKKLNITLQPELIEYAKSKGKASHFIAELLEEAKNREAKGLNYVKPEGLNELGELREITNNQARIIAQLEDRIIQLKGQIKAFNQ